jgi:protein TonB
MDVTDVLRGRMTAPGGLQKMVSISLAVHLTAAAALIVGRGGLFKKHEAPPTLMTISLSGSAGPENGGMTALGGRPVQSVTPPDEPPKREAVRAPAAKAPDMTMPLPNQKPVKVSPAPNVKQAPDEARGRTPTKGAQPAFGSAIADTGVRGQGFGLSTGGGAGSGSTLEITGDFCCPEYLATMIARIRAAWNQQQGATGTSTIRFTINKDGSITNATIFQQSGIATLDNAALRAVLATRTLPPLPDAFPNPTLTMRLTFKYE